MKKGFFSPSTLMKTRQSSILRIAHCGICKLNKNCLTPNMQPTGKGRKKILFIAEAPGREEDRDGIQLIGEAGQTLRNILDDLDIDLDRDCWKTNAVCCRPPNNIVPEDEQILACLPNVMKAIKTYNPNVIILLGGVAVKSLIINGFERKGDKSNIGTWAGWQIPCQSLNTWICPTYHPSYINRNKKFPAVKKIFRKHIKQAIKKAKSKPWDIVPDYEKEIEIIYSPRQAALAIRDFVKAGGVSAFDYETNMLKPDSELAEISSCSICWRGKRTISFPWYGDVVDAMFEFVKSPLPKIASNLRFEERWTRKFLNTPVNNWFLDTAVAAHRLDNRPDICGIKFQAFVKLGQEKWNNHIESLLKSDNSNKPNRIKEIDLKDLLLYGGLDSLLEYKVGMIQKNEMQMV